MSHLYWHRGNTHHKKSLFSILKEKNLNLDNEIKIYLRRAIKESIYSREQIVERMSLLTGKNFTKAQLDTWTAESKRAYNLPVAYLPAFVISCGREEIIEFLCQQSGGQFIRPDKLRCELFEIERNLERLDIRRKEILAYLFPSEKK